MIRFPLPHHGARTLVVALALALAVAGCSSATDTDVTNPSVPSDPVSPTVTDDVFERTTDPMSPQDDDTPSSSTTTTATLAPTTTTTAATTTTTTTATASSTTTTSTTTLPPGTPASALDLTADSVLLGTSVEGREIIAERFGTPGGRRVLVVGVIHGDEDAGVAVIDELRRRSVDDTNLDGVELWLVPSMNPDGQAAQDRHNANEVDLNRNFPFRWGTIGEPGNSQYAGPAPASEPETQAMVEFVSQLAPDLAMWYHQDANLIIPADGRDGEVRARYAELTGLPLEQCCDGGGIYTGIAATWARNEAVAAEGLAFIVELPGGDLTATQVDQHSDAVLTVSAELDAS